MPVTDPGMTHNKATYPRAAATRLEALGLIKLSLRTIDGRPRLVAYPPDARVPDTRTVTGKDGQRYRRPERE